MTERTNLVGLCFALILLLTLSPLSAEITGDPDIFDVGTWVQHPGIAVAKLFNDDSRLVAVFGDTEGRLHAKFSDGSNVPGFPVVLLDYNDAFASGGSLRSDGSNSHINSTPAVVDLEGDGDLEIFVGSGDGHIYGLDNSGQFLPGWPQFTGVSTGDGLFGVFSSPAVADLEGDGNYEVIVGSWSHYIYVWNAEDGQRQWRFNNQDTVWSSPAVLDADGDGDLEIVIGGDSSTGGEVPAGGVIRLLHHDGTPFGGNWPVWVDEVVWSSPAVGDIDNDGQPEIVVGTGIYYRSGRGEYVTALETNGSPVQGWPFSTSMGTGLSQVFGSPALADVDGDGFLETFVGDMQGYLHCINYDGSVRWTSTPAPDGVDPINVALFSSPSVGDVDGDDRFEVITGGGWDIAAFDALTGALDAGYSRQTAPYMQTWSSPTIADFDGDQLIELLIGAGASGMDTGGLWVFHESGSAVLGQSQSDTGVSADIAPWTRFRRDNSGQGSMLEEPQSQDPPPPALISGLTATPEILSPNADGKDDTVQFTFDLLEADTVSVTILDRLGNTVAILEGGSNLAPGQYNYSWGGYDQGGNRAIDGIYTCRVEGANSSPAETTVGLTVSIPESSTSWFLAEGSTVGFEAYVLVQNPNAESNPVTVTFFNQDGTTKEYTETVLPRARTTVPIHGQVPDVYSVSTVVESELPVVVERAMYFNKKSATPDAGHNSVGSTNMMRQWYFPAHRNGWGDEDFILLVNPDETRSANITARFIKESGDPMLKTYRISPTSRFTIAVHGEIYGVPVSVEILSDIPVAAERALYFDSRKGGASGIGAASTSLSWYFPDGDTVNASTIVELMNPGTSSASVQIQYHLDSGQTIARNHIVGANRRKSVNTASEIGSGQLFSMSVLSDRPIVTERLMYMGGDVGDTIGAPIPAKVWNLAEGFTAFGYETWITISNPGDSTADVQVRFLQQNGVNVIKNYQILPKNRVKIYVNDWVDPTSISTQVSSSEPVVVERTMQFTDRKGVHQALGVR